MAALLNLDGVESSYGASQVLFGMSLEIQEGEMITLLARNGMGKTTTVRTIMGLVLAHAGAIRIIYWIFTKRWAIVPWQHVKKD